MSAIRTPAGPKLEDQQIQFASAALDCKEIALPETNYQTNYEVVDVPVFAI
jgi:hypothetical protein